MTSTHIRVPVEVKKKLDSLNNGNEGVGAVISRLIVYYENQGTVNHNVNSQGNLIRDVNATTHNKWFSELSDRVKALEARGNEVDPSIDALLQNQNTDSLKQELCSLTDRLNTMESSVHQSLSEMREQIKDMATVAKHEVPEPALEFRAGWTPPTVVTDLNLLSKEERNEMKGWVETGQVLSGADPGVVIPGTREMNSEESKPSGKKSMRNKSDRVSVTGKVIQKIKALHADGMKYEKIASVLGSGRRQYVSEIVAGRTLNISKEQYDALMNLGSTHLES